MPACMTQSFSREITGIVLCALGKCDRSLAQIIQLSLRDAVL